MTANTPAGRLLRAFDKLHALDTAAPFRNLWASALDHGQNTAEEIENMAELASLLNQTQAALVALSEAGLGEREALLFHLPNWTKAVFGWDMNIAPAQNYAPQHLLAIDARHALSSAHS